MRATGDGAPRGDTAAEPGTGFTYASAELDAMAGAVNYHGAILERFVPYLGTDVVEIGAGIGTVAERLLEESARAKRPVSRLTLVEPAGNNLPTLRRRFASAVRESTRVSVHGSYFSEIAPSLEARGGVDSVLMVNVLEHVPDDGALLADVRRALRPGGHLCLFVPALPWLYGSLDRAFEHHRRYTLPGVRALLAGAGLGVRELRYVNLPGVLPWFVAGRVLRRRTLSASAVTLYDRLVTPWTRRLERRWRPPLGQSVLAVAQR